MSPILQSVATAVGGILAGLALASGLLWRQQKALAQARYDATHDETTGLANRRAALAHLNRAITGDRPFGLVLLDLDHFKTINDRFGHEAGNDLLTEVGRRLSALAHPVVLAARLSGDEFLLLVHGDTGQLHLAAEAAWQAIRTTPFQLGTDLVEISASIGYASARLGITARQLLRDADEAMYRAKTSGGGVHAYTPISSTNGAVAGRCRDRRRPHR